jgi:hypothetical protein
MPRFRSFLPVLIVVLAIAARLIPGPRTIDDSFITFRYARNVLAGQGFVYNPGEAVLGTTTPLYTLLMVGLGALSGGTQAPFPWLALGVNALADGVTCWLLWLLGRRLGFPRAGAVAALAWAIAPFSVAFAIGGLETSLYVALLTGAVVAAVYASPVIARDVVTQDLSIPRLKNTDEEEKQMHLTGLRIGVAALASLALLTRPDALILLGPLVLERLWTAWKRNQPIHWAEIAAAVIPYGTWMVYATLAFGSPLPHSILAKAAAYHLAPSDSLIRLIQHYATPFLEQNWIGAPLAVGIGLWLYPFLFVLGVRQVTKARPRPPLVIWAWVLYPWLYLVTFAIPNPLIFRWYLTPPLPAYFFFIFIGLEMIWTRLLPGKRAANKASNQGTGKRGWGVTLLLLVPVVVSLAGWRLTLDHGPSAPAPDMAFIKLELLYRQVADRIAPELTAQSVLAAGDVGVLGFFTPARILDTVGLNSPVATTYYPLPVDQYVINYAIPTGLILDQRPDWIVILEVYGRRTFLLDPQFKAQYRLVQKIETDLYESDGLLIFQRIK